MGTDINDLVLIHMDEKPATYARIEDIDPDVKPGWWRVKLLILTLPLQVATWILEKAQIDGTPFTMGGTPVRLEKVVAPEIPDMKEPPPPPPAEQKEGEQGSEKEEEKGKIISLSDRKKSK